MKKEREREFFFLKKKKWKREIKINYLEKKMGREVSITQWGEKDGEQKL